MAKLMRRFGVVTGLAVIFTAGTFSVLAQASAESGESSESLAPSTVPIEQILAIASDASNPDVLYAGTSGFGLVKSLDGGLSWNSTAPELENLVVTSVAVHPRTSQVVYAGSLGRGLWLSISAGITFEESSLGLPSPEIRDIVIDLEQPRWLYVATPDGFARSHDAGRVWQETGQLGSIRDLELGGVLENQDQAAPGAILRYQEIYALTAEGLWLSRSQGLFFDQILTPERMEALAAKSAESSAADGNRRSQEELVVTELEASDSESSNLEDLDFEGLQRDDLEQVAVPEDRKGDESAELTDDESSGGSASSRGRLANHEKLVVKVAPSDSRVIYVGSSVLGLFRSLDAGLTWQHLPQIGPVRSLAVDPRSAERLWAGTDQGVWESGDSGTSFVAIAQGGELPVDLLVINPRFPERIYAVIPNGRLLIRADDGGWSLISLRAGQLNLGDLETEAQSTGGLHRLPARPFGDPALGPRVNVALQAIEADSRFPFILYAATSHGVYRSSDSGDTWRSRLSGLGELDVTSLSVDPADSYSDHPTENALLLAGTRGAGIFRSRNSGQQWSPSSRGLRDPFVRSLIVDPHDPQFVWAGTANGGIFRSTDGGYSWVAMSEGLVEYGIRDLVIASGDLYAATDLGGVYRSSNLGLTWQALGTIGLDSPRPDWELQLKPLGIDPKALHVNALAVHPDNPEQMAAATSFGIFMSQNGGENWRWRGRFFNASDLAYDPQQPLLMAAASSRGLSLSGDGGETWQPEIQKRSREAQALVSVEILGSGEAAGTVIAGGDDGRLLLRRLAGTEPILELSTLPNSDQPTLPRLIPRRDPERDKPREDVWREKREEVLKRTMLPDPVVGIEDPRLLALLALESYLRGEELRDPSPRNLTLENALRSIFRYIADQRLDFIREAGLESFGFDPSGRLLALTYSWDDGQDSRSELRLFELDRFLLFGRETLEALGPNRFAKDLHDRHRNPEQMLPTWMASNPGRFLAWSATGTAVVTQSSASEVTIWSLVGDTGSEAPTGASRAPLASVYRGLKAPAALAAFSPSAGRLVVADLESRVYYAKLGRDTELRPLFARPLEDGVKQLVMSERGLLIVGKKGSLLFRPVGRGELRAVREPAHQLARAHIEPRQRWVLLGDELEEPGQQGWGTMTLVSMRGGEPGEPFVFGRGGHWVQARWSGDGRWLAVSRQRATELWRLGKTPILTVTEEHESLVPVRFSPDSLRLQVGSRIWSLEGDPVPERDALRGSSLRMMRSAIAETRKGLWRRFDLRRPPWNRRMMPSLEGQGARAIASADSRWLLLVAEPWQMRLWHFADESLGDLAPATGETLVSARRMLAPQSSGPSPAQYWPRSSSWGLLTRTSDVFDSVCQVAGRNLTSTEWRRFMGDEPYRKTCVKTRR